MKKTPSNSYVPGAKNSMYYMTKQTNKHQVNIQCIYGFEETVFKTIKLPPKKSTIKPTATNLITFKIFLHSGLYGTEDNNNLLRKKTRKN
jgi:hypothetical protein